MPDAGDCSARGGGRLLILEYEWSAPADPRHGVALFGRDGVYQLAWGDTWHTGDAMMFCSGGPEPSVLGWYGPVQERWAGAPNSLCRSPTAW